MARINTIGSESSNAMGKEQKAQAAWENLKDVRMAFCGSRAILKIEDRASGVMLFEGYYGADGFKSERFSAVGFSGRRKLPDFNCIFKTKEACQKFVGEWLERLRDKAERKAASRAEAAAKRAAGHKLAVGDVLATCWGYEQTNVEYYQVKGEPMRRRVCEDGRSVKIESWGIWARKLETQTVGGVEVFPVSSFSSYA